MTLCPIAIVSSCKKCPMFSVCPLKRVIGDYDPFDDDKTRPSIRLSEVEKERGQGDREKS